MTALLAERPTVWGEGRLWRALPEVFTALERMAVSA